MLVLISVVYRILQKSAVHIALLPVCSAQLRVDGRGERSFDPPGRIVVPARSELIIFADQLVVLLLPEVWKVVREGRSRFRVKKLILDCSDAIEQVAHDRVVLSRPHTGRPQIYAGRYDDRIHVDAGAHLRVQVLDVIVDPAGVPPCAPVLMGILDVGILRIQSTLMPDDVAGY